MTENEGCSGCGQSQVNGDKNNNISNQQKAPCAGCSQGQFQGKLGICQFCIATASLGTIFGWIFYFICYFFVHQRQLTSFTLVMASFFTLLLSAHGIAYLVIKNKKNNT